MKLFLKVSQFLIVIVLFICLPCCNSSDKFTENSGLISIKLNSNNLPPFSKLSDVVESVRLVPLETLDDVLLGNIRRTFIGKEYMIIQSYSGNIDFHLFSIDGKYIRKLGKNGTGPGEYSRVQSISVLEDEKLIFIQDINGRPVISYSFSGEVDKTIHLPSSSLFFTMLNKNTYAYTAAPPSDYELKIINQKDSDTMNFLPIVGENYTCEPQFYGSFHDRIFYSGIGRDTLFKVDKNGIEPVLAFDFGDGHLSGKTAFLPMMQHPAGKISLPLGVIQCGDFYQVTLQHTQNQAPPELYTAYISRQKQELRLMDIFDNPDDVIFCNAFPFREVSSNEELVTSVFPLELIEALPQITENKNFKYSEQMIDQIKNLKEDNNPVIVLFKLKKL